MPKKKADYKGIQKYIDYSDKTSLSKFTKNDFNKIYTKEILDKIFKLSKIKEDSEKDGLTKALYDAAKYYIYRSERDKFALDKKKAKALLLETQKNILSLMDNFCELATSGQLSHTFFVFPFDESKPKINNNPINIENTLNTLNWIERRIQPSLINVKNSRHSDSELLMIWIFSIHDDWKKYLPKTPLQEGEWLKEEKIFKSQAMPILEVMLKPIVPKITQSLIAQAIRNCRKDETFKMSDEEYAETYLRE